MDWVQMAFLWFGAISFGSIADFFTLAETNATSKRWQTSVWTYSFVWTEFLLLYRNEFLSLWKVSFFRFLDDFVNTVISFRRRSEKAIILIAHRYRKFKIGMDQTHQEVNIQFNRKKKNQFSTKQGNSFVVTFFFLTKFPQSFCVGFEKFRNWTIFGIFRTSCRSSKVANSFFVCNLETWTIKQWHKKIKLSFRCHMFYMGMVFVWMIVFSHSMDQKDRDETCTQTTKSRDYDNESLIFLLLFVIEYYTVNI